MLILLALFRIRKLLDGDLRLRTACDLTVDGDGLDAKPAGFELPELKDLGEALQKAIAKCAGLMSQTTVEFEDELKRGKDKAEEANGVDEGNGDDNNQESND
jgi:CRISPR-associated protein Csb1